MCPLDLDLCWKCLWMKNLKILHLTCGRSITCLDMASWIFQGCRDRTSPPARDYETINRQLQQLAPFALWPGLWRRISWTNWSCNIMYLHSRVMYSVSWVIYSWPMHFWAIYFWAMYFWVIFSWAMYSCTRLNNRGANRFVQLPVACRKINLMFCPTLSNTAHCTFPSAIICYACDDDNQVGVAIKKYENVDTSWQMTIKCLRQNKSLPAGHPSNPSAQVGPGNAEEGTLMQTNVQLCITTMSIHQSIQLIVHHWLGLKVQCIRELYSKFKPVNSDTEAKLFQSNSQWRRCWAVMSLRWPEVTVIVSHRQPLTFGAAALGVDSTTIWSHYQNSNHWLSNSILSTS